MKVIDKSMLAFHLQTWATGNLPHLSFILQKLENLGTGFKVVACLITRIILYLEIQKGHEQMQQALYSPQCSVTACMLQLVEGLMKGVQVTDKWQLYFGDSWFASVTCITELWKCFHVHFIGIVKTNHARFPKQFLESCMKNWPAGSHLVMEGLTEDGIDLLAVGYKYNTKKIQCFVSTKNIG